MKNGQTSQGGTGISQQGLKDVLGDICGATIRVECWGRSLKRGSGCNSDKYLELTESQGCLKDDI